jgi:hypothetical protein
MVTAFLMTLSCMLAPAWAATAVETDPFPSTARSADEFRSMADALRAQFASGGRYAALSAGDRAEVESDLAALQAMYDAHAQGRQVDRNQPMKISAINAYSRINAKLGGDDDSRVICEQVKKVGSNRFGKYCATVRERRENRLAAQKAHLEWFVPKPDNEIGSR